MRSWVSQLPASFRSVWTNWGDAVGGFIKLDRKVTEWGWYKDANTRSVFIHLLLMANFKDGEFRGVAIHKGEIATSYQSIANALDLSVQNVRTAISHLKLTGELTGKTYSKFQVLSIVNWNLYQGYQQASQQAANRQLGQNLTGKLTGKNGAENIVISTDFSNGEQANQQANSQSSNRQLTTIEEIKNIYSLSQREKPCFHVASVPYKAALWLSKDLCDSVPAMKPQGEDTLQSWAADFDALHNAGYKWEVIRDALAFARGDAFWKTRISSAGAFRKNFNSILVRMGGESCG